MDHTRIFTQEVNVGGVGIGGKNPIRIQSMVNVNTLNTEAVVNQTIQLADVGCELVRITAPGLAEAENLRVIKQQLRNRGYQIPLVADIHYSAKAGELAAQYVEKVRINPGNYADKKQFKQLEYTDLEYSQELERIAERINPLIRICKENGTAIRIGVNHGSLSDRIISRYGDTPHGMAMSAIEYAQICQSLGFDQLVFSMKSSDVKVMIYSTRMLMKMFHDNGLYFPIHLGVTEAGSGLDGRIRSAAGIGALLSEGIGDTIRVSLTESPVAEIPVAKAIVAPYQEVKTSFSNTLPFAQGYYKNHNPFGYEKRHEVKRYEKTVIFSDSSELQKEDFPTSRMQTFAETRIENEDTPIKIPVDFNSPILLSSNEPISIQTIKEAISKHPNINHPIIIRRNYGNLSKEELSLVAASDIGALAVDNLIDGVAIGGAQISANESYQLLLDIFQSCGLRYYKTEIISCPSCGRTNYDIEGLLKEVKVKLSGQKGLKIAVMGCVVNGPGEMSDANYGLVGAGDGMVWLYKGKTPVVKHIKQEDAVAVLVDFIKKDLG
jgi:(E)-4-hydroxy-3-methylbut-2-enyl-diphosphate synthase